MTFFFKILQTFPAMWLVIDRSNVVLDRTTDKETTASPNAQT